MAESAVAHAFLRAVRSTRPRRLTASASGRGNPRPPRTWHAHPIHGDYDVDGICSTAVLVRALRALGGRRLLPADRAGDGYGLNAATVRRLAARGTRLLMTVDCSDHGRRRGGGGEDARHGRGGHDHHAPRADGRAAAGAVVHRGCAATMRDLCATAVAYKLAQALVQPPGG